MPLTLEQLEQERRTLEEQILADISHYTEHVLSRRELRRLPRYLEKPKTCEAKWKDLDQKNREANGRMQEKYDGIMTLLEKMYAEIGQTPPCHEYKLLKGGITTEFEKFLKTCKDRDITPDREA